MKLTPAFLLTLILMVSLVGCSKKQDDKKRLAELGIEILADEPGSGPGIKEDDFIRFHYTIKNAEGEILGTSYGNPNGQTAEMGVGEFPLEGWEQSMIGMKKDGKRDVVIPSNLAFVNMPGMPNPFDVHLELELIEILEKPEPVDDPKPWTYEENDVKTMESGLQYVVHQEGSGEKPEEGNMITVHYSGFLTDGSMFDSSVKRQDPFRFMVGIGQVIQGWDVGLLDMKEGEKRTLIIPYNLAYGENGREPIIPQRATLVFDVELIAIER